VTAALLFISVRFLLVVPIKRVVGHMISYAEAPDDASRIIEPQGSVRELRDAENALQSMQTQLTGALRQRERLAQLGEAVAKISHDLRNILSVTTLMADRLEGSADPAVQRATPKILASLTRAVNLTESTLAFGRAEEPSPKLERVRLADIAEDVVENERLTSTRRPDDTASPIVAMCPADLVLRADPEQFHRVLSNLVRNARQAIAATGKAGEIRIDGRSGTAAGGSRSATPAPACRKRRSITCSSRSTAARARGAPASASPSRRRSSAAMAARWNWCKADPRDDLRHLPSRGSRRLSAKARFAPESPCAPWPPTLNPALTHR
jgi:hypothetical protein